MQFQRLWAWCFKGKSTKPELKTTQHVHVSYTKVLTTLLWHRGETSRPYTRRYELAPKMAPSQTTNAAHRCTVDGWMAKNWTVKCFEWSSRVEKTSCLFTSHRSLVAQLGTGIIPQIFLGSLIKIHKKTKCIDGTLVSFHVLHIIILKFQFSMKWFDTMLKYVQMIKSQLVFIMISYI